MQIEIIVQTDSGQAKSARIEVPTEIGDGAYGPNFVAMLLYRELGTNTVASEIRENPEWKEVTVRICKI